jgi:hypothetical protein
MRLPLALLATLACAAALAAAPAAFAAKGMEVAVQDDAVLVAGLYGNAAQGLDLAQNMSASVIRANVNWSYVVGSAAKQKKAPANIEYNWTGYDYLVFYADEHGLRVELALTGPAPAWATGNHKVGVDRVKAGAFKVFARDAAEHFKGRVTRFSIWNEPNFRGWISPLKRGPKIYRGLYTAGYSAIKAVDSSTQVLFGETSPYSRGKNATAPLKFVRGVTCANKRYKRAKKCKTLKTDGFAHHPYDFDHKPTYKYKGKDNVTLGTLSRLTSALSKLRKAKLLTTPTGGVPYIYLTEYGYFRSGKRKVSAAKQAKYLVQAFTIAQKNKRVKQMLQYLLYEPSSKYHGFDTSIVSRAGKPFLAYKKLAAWAAKALRSGRIARQGTVHSNSSPPPSPPRGDDPGGGGGGPPPPSGCAPLPICP